MFKSDLMTRAFQRLEGAKGTCFSGTIEFGTESEARAFCERAAGNSDLELTQIGVAVSVDEGLIPGRLRAVALLQSVIDSKPRSAFFEGEDEDGEQLRLELEDGGFVVLERGAFQPVA